MGLIDRKLRQTSSIDVYVYVYSLLLLGPIASSSDLGHGF